MVAIPGGEPLIHKEIGEIVRGRDVYLLQTATLKPNEDLSELFLMCQAAGLVVGMPYTEALEFYRRKSDPARQQLLFLGHLMTGLKADCLLAGAALDQSVILVGCRRKIEMEAWFARGAHSADVLIEVKGDGKDPAYELEDFLPTNPRVKRFWFASSLDAAVMQATARTIAGDLLVHSGL